MGKMLNFIPRLFYDFLGRIVPGATLIVASALVLCGPSATADLIVNPSQDYNLFTWPVFILFTLGSYLIGITLSQLWDMSVGRCLADKQLRIEKRCIKECLDEHNQLLQAMGRATLEIDADDLPRAFVMRDHICRVDPPDAERLLKVRAEMRLCQVLIIGLSIILIINVGAIFISPKTEWWVRLILEVVMGLAVVICWSRSKRLNRYYVNGSCVRWLIRASSGDLFAPNKPIGTDDKSGNGRR